MKPWQDVHMSFPREFMDFLNKWQKKTNTPTRSEFVRQAVRYYVIHLKETGWFDESKRD